MNYTFSNIIIIYNPKSTGNSKKNAVELRRELKKRLKNTTVELLATKYAGHAEKLGAKYANQKDTLLVSSSGDGGYNELINGVLSQKNNNVALSVLPSGNANDHFRATTSGSLLDQIVAGKTTKIDVLELEATINSKTWTRYAHSYIGVGLTAYIGKKLTVAKLNPLNEKWLVVKYLLRFQHVSLKITSWQQKKFYRYQSLVVANIDRMSKVIRLDDDASTNDGMFEIYAIGSKALFSLLKVLLRASMTGKKLTARAKSINFVSKHQFEVQCDGEVFKLDKNQKVAIKIQPGLLKTISSD